MSDLISTKFEITKKEVNKDNALKLGAWALPVVVSVLPSLIFLALFVLFGIGNPVAGISLLFFTVISFFIGLVLGLGGSAATLLYRSRWLAQIREKIAVDGIKANEVDWFKHELKGEEKRALKDITSKNLLLADAYRETLASRLTATRIIKSTRGELLLAKRRKNKLKYRKSERFKEFKAEIDKDIKNLSEIRKEAKEMEIEAESRLQMIDAASRRGRELAGNELALKKLSARSEQLPLALEEARMEEEFRREIEEDLEEELESR